jgi:hypothetical protein
VASYLVGDRRRLALWDLQLAQDPTLATRWKHAVPLQIITSIVAGLLAYLTANLDLFGIKLDPNILRTYPLLGFLFAYIGIDRLFAKRFGRDKGAAES